MKVHTQDTGDNVVQLFSSTSDAATPSQSRIRCFESSTELTMVEIDVEIGTQEIRVSSRGV